MASLAEVKLTTVNFLARQFTERLTPSLPLEIRFGETLESARSWNQERRNFIQAAQAYHSVYRLSADPLERTEALIGLSQELINLGKFGQARRLLMDSTRNLLSQLPATTEPAYLSYRARIHEKLAWIEDYELGYQAEIGQLLEARNWLGMIPKNGWTDRERRFYSTTTHFLGRAHFGLAVAGVNRMDNIQRATEYFATDLARYQELRQEGKPDPQGEGFQYAWLTRCSLLSKDLYTAEVYLRDARRLFEEQTEIVPRSGVMAHYYLLVGRLNVLKGEIETARSNFSEALRIRTAVEPYPKGYADAAQGLAACYLRQGRPLQAARFVWRAARAYPASLVDPILGR